MRSLDFEAITILTPLVPRQQAKMAQSLQARLSDPELP